MVTLIAFAVNDQDVVLSNPGSFNGLRVEAASLRRTKHLQIKIVTYGNMMVVRIIKRRTAAVCIVCLLRTAHLSVFKCEEVRYFISLPIYICWRVFDVPVCVYIIRFYRQSQGI